MSWDAFLRKIADDYRLSPKQTDVFVLRFSEKHQGKKEKEAEKLVEQLLGINREAYVKIRGEIYDKFTYGYPELKEAGSHKAEKLRDWLATKYSEQSEIKESASAVPSKTAIAWQQVCRKMLEEQQTQWLTKRPLSGNKSVADVYVPLELVERQSLPPRVDPEISAERGSELYHEITTPIPHREFFENVIQQGQSPKSQGRRIAIIGEPGAGKTTLLQKIAEVIQNDGLPIWVDLAQLQREENLEDYLLEKWLKKALPTIRELAPAAVPSLLKPTEELKDALAEEFGKGRVWLLLDGVDEMAAKVGNPLTEISQQLNGWIAEARVVLTCRLNVWDPEKLSQFDVYRNRDFSYPQQVREFIVDKWFGDRSIVGESLWEELERSPQRIKDLVRNPLRLALLCRTWELRQGKLPDTKAGLYQRFVEAFYDWKEQFSIPVNKQKELDRALGELAKQAIDRDSCRFRLEENFVKRFLGEPKQEGSLFWWALKVGWLNWVGLPTAEEKDPDEKVYAFFHPTFQEYFAACAIEDWHFFLNHNNANPNPLIPYNGKDCVYRIFEPQWKEVILLWLGKETYPGGNSCKEEFINALVNFNDGCWDWYAEQANYKGFYDYRAYFLAGIGISEFKNCNLASEIIKNLVLWSFGTELKQGYWPDEIYQQLVKEKDCFQTYAPNKIQEQAKEILIETDPSRVIDALIELIRTTPIEWIGMQALESLGRIGKFNQKTKDYLSKLISDNSSEQIRIKAAESLGKADPGNQQAIETLAKLADNIEEMHIAMIAASSLREIAPDHPNAAHLAERTLLLEYVKTGCFQAGDPELIDGLINNARSNKNNHNGCESITNLRYIAPTGHPLAIEVLTEIIHTTQDIGVAMAAVNSLAVIGKLNSEVVDLLIDLIKTHSNCSIRWRAIHGLLNIETHQKEVIEVLLDVLRTRSNGPFNINIPQVLGRILQKFTSQYAVSELKKYLVELLIKKDLRFYRRCYDDILGYCTQTMPYPEFYKAWHSPTTLAPENHDLTTVGSTPLTQQLNQAILPQDLRAAVDEDADLCGKVQPVCIDVEDILDPDKPWLEIYDEMIEQGCPESANGDRTFVSELKVYFKRLNKTDKRYFLIFYHRGSEPQTFPPTVLTALSKFGREVALVTEQCFDDLNLKCFSEYEAIASLIQWMRQILLES